MKTIDVQSMLMADLQRTCPHASAADAAKMVQLVMLLHEAIEKHPESERGEISSKLVGILSEDLADRPERVMALLHGSVHNG